MTKQIIFVTTFTKPFTPKVTITKEWLDYRFDFWLSHTYKSIMSQDFPDIKYWLISDEQYKPLVEEYKERIDDPRCKLIYREQSREELLAFPDSDYYLLPRIDSDDLYRTDTARFLLNQPIPEGKDFFQFTTGYCFDTRTNKIYSWYQKSGPFYTFIYPKEKFRKLQEITTIDHSRVHFTAQQFPDKMLMVLLHGRNTEDHLRDKGLSGKELVDTGQLKDFLRGCDLGLGDPEAYSLNYSEKETTGSQKKVETYLQKINTEGKTILLVGIGNSKFVSLFGGKNIIDGISINVHEINKGKKAGYRNLWLFNKYDPKLFPLLSTYDIIVDVNPKSFACCLYHFWSYMRNILSRLKPGGKFYSSEDGLNWVQTDGASVNPKILGLPPLNKDEEDYIKKLGYTITKEYEKVFIISKP